MASTTGTVHCVQISEDSAFTTLEEAGGNREVFILWFLPGTSIPAQLNSFTRVLHSMWVSLLREAHSNGSEIKIFHPNGSAEVLTIQLR